MLLAVVNELRWLQSDPLSARSFANRAFGASNLSPDTTIWSSFIVTRKAAEEGMKKRENSWKMKITTERKWEGEGKINKTMKSVVERQRIDREMEKIDKENNQNEK